MTTRKFDDWINPLIARGDVLAQNELFTKSIKDLGEVMGFGDETSNANLQMAGFLYFFAQIMAENFSDQEYVNDNLTRYSEAQAGIKQETQRNITAELSADKLIELLSPLERFQVLNQMREGLVHIFKTLADLQACPLVPNDNNPQTTELQRRGNYAEGIGALTILHQRLARAIFESTQIQPNEYSRLILSRQRDLREPQRFYSFLLGLRLKLGSDGDILSHLMGISDSVNTYRHGVNLDSLLRMPSIFLGERLQLEDGRTISTIVDFGLSEADALTLYERSLNRFTDLLYLLLKIENTDYEGDQVAKRNAQKDARKIAILEFASRYRLNHGSVNSFITDVMRNGVGGDLREALETAISTCKH